METEIRCAALARLGFAKGCLFAAAVSVMEMATWTVNVLQTLQTGQPDDRVPYTVYRVASRHMEHGVPNRS